MTERNRNRPLPVAFRRIERVQGQREGVVYCSRRNRTAAVGECKQCEHCQGVCIDIADGEAFVRCAWLHDRAAPRAGAHAAAALATIMSSPVQCVSPDDTLEHVRTLLSSNGIGAVPVIDASGGALGVITKTDVLCAREGEAQPTAETRARHVMSHIVFTLHAEADVSRAAALMASEGVHHVIVSDADGRPAGIVSSIDILRWLAREHGYVMPEK